MKVMILNFLSWFLRNIFLVGLAAGRKSFELDQSVRKFEGRRISVRDDVTVELEGYKALVSEALESGVLSDDERDEILVIAARDLVRSSGLQQGS